MTSDLGERPGQALFNRFQTNTNDKFYDKNTAQAQETLMI